MSKLRLLPILNIRGDARLRLHVVIDNFHGRKQCERFDGEDIVMQYAVDDCVEKQKLGKHALAGLLVRLID